ncbi:S1/P1 nuclease, partial [Clohesyomyces aquaticus]
LLVLTALPAARAWGELGHRTVGYLAEKYFTDEASTMVSELLANDRGYDISDAALWADSVRRRKGYTHTGPWHYIDAEDKPPKQCGVKYNRDCKPEEGCVVSAIANMTTRLLNTTLPSDQHKESLMFIIHFIGDIHQPLHTEALDRGGNEIHACFDSHCGKKENLHSIWDKDIPHKMRGLPSSEGDDVELKGAAKEWADELFGKNEAREECTASEWKGAEDCALEWAGESNKYVCDYVLKKGKPWIESHDLGVEYFKGAVPVVNELVGKAGARLGAYINAL